VFFSPRSSHRLQHIAGISVHELPHSSPHRTTPKIRQEIKDSGLSDREAAKVFNITRATASKSSLKRDDVQERLHADTLHITLSAMQEAILLPPHQSPYLLLDDLLH